MILASRRQAENCAVWSARIIPSVRPRLVVHSNAWLGRGIVAETSVKRELSSGFVEIRHHHAMRQVSISGDHDTTMIGFDRDPMWDIAFSEHDTRNLPRPGWIRDVQTDHRAPGWHGHQIVVSGNDRNRAVGTLL